MSETNSPAATLELDAGQRDDIAALGGEVLPTPCADRESGNAARGRHAVASPLR